MKKITLVNEQFVVWIVPENVHGVSKTITFIAIEWWKRAQIGNSLCVSGVYNTSKLVLRVLEKLLQEIKETADAMNEFRKAC